MNSTPSRAPYTLSAEELELRQDIERYTLERERITQRMLKLQTELAEINKSIRGKYLLPTDYRNKCARQVHIKQELVKLVASVKSVNGHVRKTQLQIDALHVENKAAAPAVDDGTATKLEAVAKKLVDMRAHYLAFARDDTRVNSMRKLAAEFASRLTEVLKEV